MIGLGLRLWLGSAHAFSISDLFANGTYAGFDFTDLDITKVWGPGGLGLFYKDQANTLVASSGDAVQLALDKSQGVAIGSELVPNPGAPFASTTGWTAGDSAVLSVAGGNLVITQAAVSFPYAFVDLTTVVGNLYKVVINFQSLTGAGQAYADIQTASVFYQSSSITQITRYFKAVGTTSRLRVAINSGTTGDALAVASISFKPISGNHALQATGSAQPKWQANSGKPYLNTDGVDDGLVSPFLPTAAMTIACAFNSATASGILLGGGDTASSHRAFLALDSSGKLAGGWGAQSITTIFAGADIRSANHVGLLTADAVSVDLYLDGVQIYTGAPSGSPNGGTGGMALGAFNNAGTLGSFSAAKIFAGLVLNRRATLAEIANITSKLRSTYQ